MVEESTENCESIRNLFRTRTSICPCWNQMNQPSSIRVVRSIDVVPGTSVQDAVHQSLFECCPNCKKSRIESLAWQSWPQFLIFSPQMWFDWGDTSNMTIELPGSNSNYHYALHAVVHYRSSHIVSFVRRGAQWYYCNDSYVVVCNQLADLAGDTEAFLLVKEEELPRKDFVVVKKEIYLTPEDERTLRKAYERMILKQTHRFPKWRCCPSCAFMMKSEAWEDCRHRCARCRHTFCFVCLGSSLDTSVTPFCNDPQCHQLEPLQTANCIQPRVQDARSVHFQTVGSTSQNIEREQ